MPHSPLVYLPDGTLYNGADRPGLSASVSVWTENQYLVNQGVLRYALQVEYADTMLGQVLDALGEEELTAMILDLREPYRTPCRLVLLEQHTMAEAAQLCGRPPKTVEAQIYRAKKMLAQQILQRENDGKECVHGTV